MTSRDIQRLRQIATWLLGDAQDVEVWDDFDVAAYDLKAIADRAEEPR